MVIPFVSALVSVVALVWQAPALDSTERARARQMLNEIKSAIRSTYYDQAFRGLDLNQHFKAAETKIDAAVSLGHAYAVIAQALIDFGDSHTFFLPPQRAATFEYGWEMQMIGDTCYVVAVKPGSDAEKKGLKPGDQLLRIEAFTPTRTDLWKARYLYYVLSPRGTMNLVAQSPGGEPRTLSIAAKVTPGQQVIEVNIDNFLETGTFGRDPSLAVISRYTRAEGIALWKLPGFDFQAEEVDRLIDAVVKDASSVVVDLRGNGGGSVKTLEHMTGRFFERDVKIADLKGHRSTKASIAKKRRAPFSGKVVVLIDADSGSAAELFARVIQLERRGVVIGDRSSGSVMQSRRFMSTVEGLDGFIPFGASITEADVIMTDGKSLEHVGVAPDELIRPTPADLAAGRDPVLARAVEMLGGTLDPASAGKIFPIEWK
jgi:carboxyl-terminal processing protease